MQIKVLKQVLDYLDGLQDVHRAAVDAGLEELVEYGLKAPFVSLRKIEGKLWEIRIDQTRIFYMMFDGDTMVLLHAYKKQGQKSPTREIQTAKRRMKELLAE